MMQEEMDQEEAQKFNEEWNKNPSSRNQNNQQQKHQVEGNVRPAMQSYEDQLIGGHSDFDYHDDYYHDQERGVYRGVGRGGNPGTQTYFDNTGSYHQVTNFSQPGAGGSYTSQSYTYSSNRAMPPGMGVTGNRV